MVIQVCAPSLKPEKNSHRIVDGPRASSISLGIPSFLLEKENEKLVIVAYLGIFALIAWGIVQYVKPILQQAQQDESVPSSIGKKVKPQ